MKVFSYDGKSGAELGLFFINYMKENNTTLREMEKVFGTSRTTIYNKIVLATNQNFESERLAKEVFESNVRSGRVKGGFSCNKSKRNRRKVDQ